MAARALLTALLLSQLLGAGGCSDLPPIGDSSVFDGSPSSDAARDGASATDRGSADRSRLDGAPSLEASARDAMGAHDGPRRDIASPDGATHRDAGGLDARRDSRAPDASQGVIGLQESSFAFTPDDNPNDGVPSRATTTASPSLDGTAIMLQVGGRCDGPTARATLPSSFLSFAHPAVRFRVRTQGDLSTGSTVVPSALRYMLPGGSLNDSIPMSAGAWTLIHPSAAAFRGLCAKGNLCPAGVPAPNAVCNPGVPPPSPCVVVSGSPSWCGCAPGGGGYRWTCVPYALTLQLLFGGSCLTPFASPLPTAWIDQVEIYDEPSCP